MSVTKEEETKNGAAKKFEGSAQLKNGHTQRVLRSLKYMKKSKTQAQCLLASDANFSSNRMDGKVKIINPTAFSV